MYNDELATYLVSQHVAVVPMCDGCVRNVLRVWAPDRDDQPLDNVKQMTRAEQVAQCGGGGARARTHHLATVQCPAELHYTHGSSRGGGVAGGGAGQQGV